MWFLYCHCIRITRETLKCEFLALLLGIVDILQIVLLKSLSGGSGKKLKYKNYSSNSSWKLCTSYTLFPLNSIIHEQNLLLGLLFGSLEDLQVSGIIPEKPLQKRSRLSKLQEKNLKIKQDDSQVSTLSPSPWNEQYLLTNWSCLNALSLNMKTKKQ